MADCSELGATPLVLFFRNLGSDELSPQIIQTKNTHDNAKDTLMDDKEEKMPNLILQCLQNFVSWGDMCLMMIVYSLPLHFMPKNMCCNL